MKILITGAYGFVGTNLCRFLSQKGHTCIAMDLDSARRDDVPYRGFRSWDQLDDSWSELAAFEVIIHLAGKAHDLKKVASEQSYFDVNVGLTQRIFSTLCEAREKGKQAGCSRGAVFIYFSSSKADAHGNAYGRSKLAAEEWLSMAMQKKGQTSGVQTIVLRPAMIHGPGNKGNLNLLWNIARRGFPWPLASFENQRSFTSIGNLCAVVETLGLTCIQATNFTPKIETYLVADDETVSTNRLVELIAEVTGKRMRAWRIPKKLMYIAARLGDWFHLPLNSERLYKLIEDNIIDNTELKRRLDWQQMPIRSEDGLRTTFHAYCS